MKWMRLLSAGALIVGVALGNAGCSKEEKTPLDETSESVEKALEGASVSIDEIGEKVKDAAKDEKKEE